MKTCYPAADKISTSCSPLSMKMTIDECVYGSETGLELQIADDSCEISQNGTFFTAEFPLNACGTTQKSENGHIIFENTFSIKSRASPIVTGPSQDFSFFCNFPTQIETSISNNVPGENLNHHTATGGSATGNFVFKIQYLQDEGDGSFVPSTNNSSDFGDTLTFDILNEGSVPGISFFVKECRVSPVEDPTQFHNIINDSCADVTVNGIFLSSRVSETSVRFQYQNFGFEGIVDDIELEVTCTINLCETTDCGTLLLAC